MVVNSIFEKAKENWIVLAFIVSLIVSWTQFQGRITSLETRTTALELSMTEVNKTNSDILVQLAKIQTTLEFIKNQIN